MVDSPGKGNGANSSEMEQNSYEEVEAQGRLGLARDSEQARKALLSRPRFSLRLQIFLGNALAFAIAIAIAIALVASFHRVEGKVRFLEIVNDYVMEVEQARRFEKNFFLYGTNLSDAQDNVFSAETILNRNGEELAAILGPGWRAQMLPNLHRYQQLLEKLTPRSRPAGPWARTSGACCRTRCASRDSRWCPPPWRCSARKRRPLPRCWTAPAS